ncbi:hypothetical protein HYQ45_013518 [Verticillium longisporum]|uniref:DUF7136 domain-containing protein n=2 Tax=Verticillium TaxID=1036719 RepID=A0A8I2ZC98_VERLO|nr:Putative D-arabinono-1,4-lactone oxidase [Verticillium dahliae VDG2]KAG7124930.1 hypothetical protein HYQ45_013518 [Verticillium longisporum]PNH28707.1 hypothetical protein BJF96_g8081 [Verticillium dahliae]PNH47964.1 hypothetical protein VD0004_g470 [Verticillium dahliae]PNH49825.1 hypothetical protein VD0003_g7344 [Verticillium dahliae]
MLFLSPWPWVLAALTLAHQPVAAELPSNAIELDLVFPRAGGVYAETEIGLPVLVSLQNPNAAYHYGWSIEWSVSFSQLTTFHGLMPSLNPRPETTSSCAVTASITHEVQPCAATAGEAQEMSLSSRMQWGGSCATGGAAPSQTGAAASVGPLVGIGALGLVGVLAGLT